jgi:hypothetical protein
MMQMSTAADDAVADYLDDLRDALIGAPRPRRRELVAEIEAHIAQARAELDDPFDEIAVRNLLERLGDPAQIAAEEIGTAPVPPAPSIAPAPPGNGGAWREPAAIVLLLFGAFAGGIGWLIGLVLLWASPRWNDRDKLLGTLVLPGGLLAAFFLGFWVLVRPVASVACASDSGIYPTFTNGSLADPCGGTDPLLIVLLVLAVAAPILTAVHLARQLRATA